MINPSGSSSCAESIPGQAGLTCEGPVLTSQSLSLHSFSPSLVVDSCSWVSPGLIGDRNRPWVATMMNGARRARTMTVRKGRRYYHSTYQRAGIASFIKMETVPDEHGHTLQKDISWMGAGRVRHGQARIECGGRHERRKKG